MLNILQRYGHFLFLLLQKMDSEDFSSSFITRIKDVLTILHFFDYHSKRITYETDDGAIKKKLLLHIIEDNTKIKIANNLTLPELQKKLSNLDFDKTKKIIL